MSENPFDTSSSDLGGDETMPSGPGLHRIGKYPVKQKLGQGGMGEVWLAHHPDLDIPVAIKTLPTFLVAKNKGYIDRFIKEARTAARINHANVVRIYDAGVDDDIHFIVMEYVDGGTVKEWMQRERLSTAQAVDITIAIAEALKAAAEYNIIHRDIKPDNIMLDGKGTPKLSDLGLAKQVETVDDLSVTAPGSTIGTPNYISPEQVQDSKSVDARADIYSLGATFYHMAVNDVPYSASSSFELLLKHVQEPLPPPQERNPDLPDNVAAVICKMMEKNRDRRYQTADEVLQDLNKIKHANAPVSALIAGGRAPAAEADPTPTAGGKSKKLLAAAAILLLALAVFGGIVMFGPGAEPGPDPEPDPTPAVKPQPTALQADEDARRKAEQERLAEQQRRTEAARKAEAEAKRRAADEAARREAEKRARLQAAARKRAEREARDAAIRKQRAERKAREIAAATKKAEEEARKAREALQKAQEEAKMREAERLKLEREARLAAAQKKKLEDEAKRIKEETARLKAEREAAAAAKREEEARQKAEEARLLSEAQKRAEKAAQAAAEAKRKSEEEARRKAAAAQLAAVERRKMEEQAAREAAEAKRKADEEARKAAAARRAAGLVDRPKEGKPFLLEDLNLVLVPIRAGTFQMGSKTIEFGRKTDETPHKVTLRRSFWIGRYEVTRKQYRQITGVPADAPEDDDDAEPAEAIGENRPAEPVLWKNAVAFCGKLTERESKTGRLPKGYVYRLPTEAEWEYCCRADTTTAYSFGNANFQMEKYGVVHNRGVQHAADVGTRLPNPWGIYDMHGNVAEWCLDKADVGRGYVVSNEVYKGAQTDPVGKKGRYRISRGGSWRSKGSDCRSARRSALDPNQHHAGQGFRIVLAPALK